MSRVYFAQELDTAATWWRIFRRDGVALAFTTHDRDLWFDGLLHRAAPGMLPSAIRRTVALADDAAEVEGALSHAAISAGDLAAGRFDGARIETGVVDWQTLEAARLYSGSIDGVAREGPGFTAQMRSLKADLDVDPVPRTSPACRAEFCGPGCDLNAQAFERRTMVNTVDHAANRVAVDTDDAALFVHGRLRWLDGPQTGMTMRILAASPEGLLLDLPLDPGSAAGQRVILRQGCDHTIATCATRFGNAINFRGEPFLPGNDMLAQYPVAR